MSKKVEKILKNLPDSKPVAQAIIIERQQKRIEQLQNQLKEAEEVVEYFISNYECDGTEFGIEPLTEKDTVEKAREYFKKYGVKDE